MVLAAPELVIAEVVELLHEVEVAAELQHRMLAERVVRGEEGSEFQAFHQRFLVSCCCFLRCHWYATCPEVSTLALAERQCIFPGNGKWDASRRRGARFCAE